MTHCTGTKTRLTIGLDLGDRVSTVCVLRDGEVRERTSVPTERRQFERYFSTVEPCRVIMEAGAQSPWVSRLVASFDHEVVVANPRRVQLISQNVRKTDPGDAELLARLGAADVQLLSPIQHRGEQAQADLALLRSRDALVKARTQLINHVRGSAKLWGVRLRSCSAGAFHKRVPEQLPEAVCSALAPLLAIIGELTAQIRAYERRVEAVGDKRYEETHVLRQVKGVGVLTSMAYVLTLEDPDRFENRRQVGSYVGLTPRQQASGSQDPQLRITKAGNEFLRRLLVGSAHYVLGPHGADCDLRRWGMELAARGGKNAKKRAVVAVARKLAVLLHRLWVTGEVYDPLRNSNRRAA